jgi:RNA polymerase sigma-70 factor (ECF subfamily)
MPVGLARVGLPVCPWRVEGAASRLGPALTLRVRIRLVTPPANDTVPDLSPNGKAVDPIDAVPDQQLIERCREGDAQAFTQLFRAHREQVARLAYRMLGGIGDLEDVVQEVFLQVYRSLHDFRGQARFSTWLYRVTVNVVLMHRRAARSRPVLVTGTLAPLLLSGDALPDEQVARRSRVVAFRRLLDRLSDKKRTVFILHELEGLPPAEVAAIVGAPVLTVRTRLFYARRELLSMLRDDPELANLAVELQRSAENGPLAPVEVRR